MKILITGSSGFIGFSLANKLLSNKNVSVLGIDNHDDYYSVKLKNKRLNILKNHKNFNFKKIDISNKKNLFKFLKNKKFDYIFHFAAQAGVRYTFENPYKYIETNIKGFVNLTDAIQSKPKKFFYASSSSVYGDVKSFPVTEKQILSPKNIYGMSKVINEDIAEFLYKKKKSTYIGLRFYTVFGPWGRPDMFLQKIFKCIFNNKTFQLNNNGNHERDFTYIDDVVNLMILLMKKKINNKHQVFNVCSNKPKNILKIAKYIKKDLSYFKMRYIKKHKADVLKTHGNNKKIIKITNYRKFTNIYSAINETFKWYKKFNIYKID